MSDTIQDSAVESPDPSSQNTRGKDAEFIGWQERLAGEPIALYNVTCKEHSHFGSTVSHKSLHELNLNVPETPLPQARWKGPRKGNC
jgi:hypothetical protein